ncbi:hypothetical protein [Mumia sp. Pv 4-285]|uniref:hypothetical protein n=1 Tax=Mumia qirimensis TaxID=3234852 RepID=UPI00351D2EF7
MQWGEMRALAIRRDVSAARLARLAYEASGWLIELATERGELDIHTASLELSLATQQLNGGEGGDIPTSPDTGLDLRDLALLVSEIARAASTRCSNTVNEIDAAMLLESAARRLEQVGA